jgi:cytochrome b6-f complex iron-sulfur subunit
MQEPPTPQTEPGGQGAPEPPQGTPGATASAQGHRPFTRRRLVRLGWITAVLVAVGGQLWLLLKLFLAPLTPGEGRGQFTLGPLEQFPVGSVTHFRPGRFLLIRQPTGVLALSDECTHQKCTVDYLPERDVIFCPCHGAQFSVTGAVLAGPAPRPLDRFAATVQDGHVIVDTTHRSTS